MAITYTLAGTTATFKVFYDSTFDAANGAQRAADWLAVIEQDLNLLKGWWGATGYSASLPVNVWLDNPANSANPFPNSGAYWGVDPNFGTHVNSTAGSPVSTIRGAFIGEVMEHFEKIQNKGWFPAADGRGGNEGTNGDALSIIASREMGRILNEPIILKGSGWAEAWLNSPRSDFVNVTTADYTQAPGGVAPALGCGVLFINWLQYELGYTMTQICQAASPTLAGVYGKLTGSSADPFPIFKGQLGKAYPQGTTADLSNQDDICNPYPMATNPVPVPDAGSGEGSIDNYFLAGATEHFRVYYDKTFTSGRARAMQWLGVVEDDFKRCVEWFGDGVTYQTNPVNLLLTKSDSGQDYGGATWRYSDFQTTVRVAETTSLGVVRFLHVAELSEQFMYRQNRGWFVGENSSVPGNEGTHGEALSMVCGLETARAIKDARVLSGVDYIDWAGDWLNGGRPDSINSTHPTYSSSDFSWVGGEVLFLYWLMFENGFALRDIVQAAGPNMRSVYEHLTLDSADPFPGFRDQLEQKFPSGQQWNVQDRTGATAASGDLTGVESQNPYPIAAPPAEQYPGTEYVPVPAERITGYVDGLTVSGATSQFTVATELAQFATGDMVIPPVTSGSPLAAVDLCWQLAGNRRFASFVDSGTYWSLQGHEAGIDVVKQKLVTGKDESVYRLFHEKIVAGVPQGAVYRCWRVKDTYTAQGWIGFPDAIYSTAGLGSSPSVRPGTRTQIVATTRPGANPVRFTFGTSFTDLGYGPNGEKEGLGKFFTVSLDNTQLVIRGGYRKNTGVPVSDVQTAVSTQALAITKDSIVQIIIGLEWTDSTTFTVHAYAALENFVAVHAALPMTDTGVDLFAARWRHIGAVRGLFVQTVDINDPVQAMSNLIGPYEVPVPLRTTLQNWGLDQGSLILGTTTGLWDYLTQIAVARQVDLRTDHGVPVISAMQDVTYTSYLWDPVATPSVSLGVDSTARKVEVVRSRATWSPSGVSFYDSRHADSETFTVTPGTSQDFSLAISASATLFYNPAPVGRPSSITQDMLDKMDAEQKANPNATSPGPAEKAVDDASQADAMADYNEFMSVAAHPYGAFVVTGTFAGVDNHTMPAKEWIAYGGSVQVTPVDDTNLKVTVSAPSIPGWTGDYTIGFSDGQNSFPALRIMGNGITYTQETLQFNTGANPRTTTTDVGTTIENVAATSLKAVNDLATRAINDASGPSMQLSAAVSMAEVHGWNTSLGLIPGSTLLYANMQWRITSATFSNASVQITATPYTTYQSAYWAYNWQGLTMKQFQDYWDGQHWDDYKVEPLSGAVADWTNTGGIVKHTLFPLPDPNDPTVPLEPSEDLLPSRFVLPYAGLTGPGAAAVFPSNTLFPDA